MSVTIWALEAVNHPLWATSVLAAAHKTSNGSNESPPDQGQTLGATLFADDYLALCPMQVAVQPLRRQSQPDTLVLSWQPTVPKEHCWQLTLLWRLTHIATSRVISYITPLQPSLLDSLMNTKKGVQRVCVLISASFGLFGCDTLATYGTLSTNGFLGSLCTCMTLFSQQEKPGTACSSDTLGNLY